MKAKILFLGLYLASLQFAALAEDTIKVETKEYRLPKCDAPQTSILLGKVTCKAAQCQSQASDSRTGGIAALVQLAGGAGVVSFEGIGDGLGAMLTTALKETNCFDVQDRESMKELREELALVGKTLAVEQSKFMISASITSINMQTDRKSFGGGFIPFIGAVTSTTQKASLGLDVKIVDIEKAKIVAAKTITGDSETSASSFGAGGIGAGGILAGGLSSVKGTPMEGVVREVLAQTASYIAGALSSQQAALASAPNPAQEPKRETDKASER